MAESNRRLPTPGYGTINTDLIGRWLRIDPADDGPFWALNLMRYREVAEYEDGDIGASAGASLRSGREADDAYAPLGPLKAIGARVVFVGDVIAQAAGAPEWHRIGIVRYPSRAAFFAMQQRDDFKSKHVHKEAGMEFTIVMSCLPANLEMASLAERADRPIDGGDLGGDLGGDPGADQPAGRRADPVTFVVEPAGVPARPAVPGEVIAQFDVEGVIVGDERRWSRVTVIAGELSGTEAHDAPATTASAGAQIITCRPSIDHLAVSITEYVDGSASAVTATGEQR